MPISVERFCAIYPQLFHMTEVPNWPSIRQHGLLSTTALLDLYQIPADHRSLLESQQRKQSVTLTHPEFAPATLRDQKPLSESSLQKCLVGCTPADWYRLLNRKVFFWPTSQRVDSLLKAYRGRDHVVLTLDTRSLLEHYTNQVLLSPINSGCTIRKPSKRGPTTFQSLNDYPFDQRKKTSGLLNAVAELTIDYAVPDVHRHLLNLDTRRLP